MIADTLKAALKRAAQAHDIAVGEVQLEHPGDAAHGEYASNIALIYAKVAGTQPRELAQSIADHVRDQQLPEVATVEVAGPGFINFYLTRAFYQQAVANILEAGESYGRNAQFAGTRVTVEYTDPNPFKELHIGHLMSNTIGESLSRLIECSGATLVRANYQGDVGLHVAKALYGMQQLQLAQFDMAHISEAYALGATAYEEDEQARERIEEINRLVYERSDTRINELYEIGRSTSLDYFESLYEQLGTAFDYYFFESDMAADGLSLVREHITDGVFEESDGAVVFRGEAFDEQLHTRVFITHAGLPTYEAKELGLAKHKEQTWSADAHITITAEEQRGYFNVVRAAMAQIDSTLAQKMQHVTHGHMRLPTGKMSSRTGNVVTAEGLLQEATATATEKTVDPRVTDRGMVAQQVALGALRYQILRQSAGKDIVFEFERALSLEGESGPYLQYAQTRAASVLEKAREAGIEPDTSAAPAEAVELEQLLHRFPEVVERATLEYEPHHVATYLTQLASAFNRWYAQEKIVDERPEAPYRVALTRAFQITMLNGLWLLGIPAPERM
jgi:arginyl-tRNA synthetase